MLLTHFIPEDSYQIQLTPEDFPLDAFILLEIVMIFNFIHLDTMTDNKSSNNNYYQFNNPSTQHNNYQQHPQQAAQNSQQKGLLSYKNDQQPSSQGYQPPSSNPTYQQGGMYHAHPQSNYYNSYQYPVEQPYNSGNSSSPSEGEAEQHRFYTFLWATFIYETIGFGYSCFVFVTLLIMFSFNIWSTLWIVQGLIQTLAIISCNQLIKGLRLKDAKFFSQGKIIFTVLVIAECCYLIVFYLVTSSNKVSYHILLYILVGIVPALAFLCIIWDCEKFEKCFRAEYNVSAAPLV